MNRQRLTYYNLLNGYYNLSIQSHVESKANSLFLGLLHKANKLGLPRHFSLSNFEALSLGGATSLSMFKRDRRRLQEFRVYRRKLLTYTPGTKNVCGTYKINYNVLLDYCRIPSASTEKGGQKVKDSEPHPDLHPGPILKRREDKNKNTLPYPNSNSTPISDSDSFEIGREGGVILNKSQKTEAEVKELVESLKWVGVEKKGVPEHLSEKYDTFCIYRQIKQLQFDLSSGQKMNNPGGVLVHRIEANHPTPDYPPDYPEEVVDADVGDVDSDAAVDITESEEVIVFVSKLYDIEEFVEDEERSYRFESNWALLGKAMKLELAVEFKDVDNADLTRLEERIDSLIGGDAE